LDVGCWILGDCPKKSAKGGFKEVAIKLCKRNSCN
jgi:hypothetical protein